MWSEDEFGRWSDGEMILGLAAALIIGVCGALMFVGIIRLG